MLSSFAATLMHSHHPAASIHTTAESAQERLTAKQKYLQGKYKGQNARGVANGSTKRSHNYGSKDTETWFEINVLGRPTSVTSPGSIPSNPLNISLPQGLPSGAVPPPAEFSCMTLKMFPLGSPGKLDLTDQLIEVGPSSQA